MPSIPAALVLLALFTASCATTPATQTPGWREDAEKKAFLWEVTAADAPDRPLYLTGTVHAGRSGELELPRSVQAAFERSAVLVVEFDPEQLDPGEMQRLIMQLGTIPPPGTLTAQLSEQTRELLPAALERVGLPLEAAQQLRPWFLATMLSLLELQRAGYSQDGGLDQRFLAAARGQKEILQLETMEEQLQSLALLPAPVQDVMLRDQLTSSGSMGLMMAQLITAWQGGNPDALRAVLFTHAKDETYAPMYEAIFFRRNGVMASRIAKLVGSPKIHFVAVGAGHVVGAEGVPALLSQEGFRVRQVAADAL
jgi:uncharacterized protein